MRILQVHNEYFSGFGGEDTVVRMEKALLERHGHDVQQLMVSTAALQGASIVQQIGAASSWVWSQESRELVAKEVERVKPDIVHVHNIFPLLSPSIYAGAREHGAAVVQTLHNYRIACTNGLLVRNGTPCELCVGRSKWRGAAYRCYTGSLPISLTTAIGQTFHRMTDSYRKDVDAFIALTEFQRDIMIREGLQPEFLFVKPHFLEEAESAQAVSPRKKQIVYVGNFLATKGVGRLLDAWSKANLKEYQLLLVGHGKDREALEALYPGNTSIVWHGKASHREVMQILAESKYFVSSSLSYETFGMVALEAFSRGTPAIVPDHGALKSMVQNQSRGFLYKPGDVPGLTAALEAAISVDELRWQEMSQAAFERAEEFNPEENYERLMHIYESAREHYVQSGAAARTTGSRS